MIGLKRGSLVAGSLLSVAFASAAMADAPAAKWYDTVSVNGYVQGSYVGNLNRPKTAPGSGAIAGNVGREYDTDSNSFNLNSFVLQVSKPVGDDHYGFVGKIRTGHDANVLNGGSDSSEFFVQEAYVTYAVPSLSKLSFIGGKFVTPEGYEGADTVSNPNFSEGLLFTYAEPVTHTGVKANYVFSDKANATIGLVNGWDNTSDNNTGKTILWQLATTPMKMITWSFQGLYGKEQNDPSHSQRLSLDTVLGVNPTDKLSLAAQGNWGEETNVVNGEGTANWAGLGAWASYALTSKFTETVRFEVMRDQNNANRFGASNFSTTGTPNQTVKEFTLTHKTMLTSALGTRLEYRHDWSNEAYFVKKDGSSVRNQNTISMDWFVTF